MSKERDERYRKVMLRRQFLAGKRKIDKFLSDKTSVMLILKKE